MTIADIAADVAFTLSPMGRERREDREIAYAEEIARLKDEVRTAMGGFARLCHVHAQLMVESERLRSALGLSPHPR